MKKALLSGAAVLLAAPALAADLPTKKAPVLPVITEYDWTGFYFGGNVGGVWGSSNYNDFNSNTGVWVDSGHETNSSAIGGGQAGYRYMFPQRFVIGAEASLDWFANSTQNPNTAIVSNKASEWETWSGGWGGYVAGLAGYAWGDFLPYVKGGWAWSQATTTHFQSLGTIGSLAAPNAESAQVNRSGWTIGGGVAYHFWSNWELFGQYMYANYGTANINYLALQRSVHTSLNTSALTFGVNLKM